MKIRKIIVTLLALATVVFAGDFALAASDDAVIKALRDNDSVAMRNAVDALISKNDKAGYYWRAMLSSGEVFIQKEGTTGPQDRTYFTAYPRDMKAAGNDFEKAAERFERRAYRHMYLGKKLGIYGMVQYTEDSHHWESQDSEYWRIKAERFESLKAARQGKPRASPEIETLLDWVAVDSEFGFEPQLFRPCKPDRLEGNAVPEFDMNPKKFPYFGARDHLESYFNYATCLFQGEGKLARDEKKAVRLWMDLAGSKVAPALRAEGGDYVRFLTWTFNNLAYAAYHRKGVDGDQAENRRTALKLLDAQALTARNYADLTAAAHLFNDAYGGQQDFPQAYGWYKRVADEYSSCPAYLVMTYMTEKGIGTRKDERAAKALMANAHKKVSFDDQCMGLADLLSLQVPSEK